MSRAALGSLPYRRACRLGAIARASLHFAPLQAAHAAPYVGNDTHAHRFQRFFMPRFANSILKHFVENLTRLLYIYPPKVKSKPPHKYINIQHDSPAFAIRPYSTVIH